MKRKKFIQSGKGIETVIDLDETQIGLFEKNDKGQLIIDNRLFEEWEETEDVPDLVKGAMGNSIGSAQALKLMEENGIDPAQITGTGTDGKITVQDVRTFIDSKPKE